MPTATSITCRNSDSHPRERTRHVTAAHIYKWKDDYFCEGDIIGALIEDPPWSGWVELGHDPDAEPVEVTLNHIAEFFHINRRDVHQLEAEKFPILVRTIPEPPAFCRVCLRWFS